VATRARGKDDQLVRLAAAPSLSATPLLDDLAGTRHVEVLTRPPSELAAMLEGRHVDVALLPVMDLQHMAPTPAVLSVGCVANAGTSLAARVFSRVPPENITRLHADPDSRPFTALPAVLWGECFHCRLTLEPLDATRGSPPAHLSANRLSALPPMDSWAESASGKPGEAAIDQRHEALLVVGDKALTDPPKGYPWQMDLGEAWQELIGLPFVFAVWALGENSPVRGNEKWEKVLTKRLAQARRRGAARGGQIASLHARQLGWPTDLAVRHLTEDVQYEFTDRHREGMEVLFNLAHKHQLIPEVKPMTYISAD